MKTLQFPFSYISGDKELELVAACKKAHMGFYRHEVPLRRLITNSAAGLCLCRPI
jgi:hypothetical protein